MDVMPPSRIYVFSRRLPMMHRAFIGGNGSSGTWSDSEFVFPTGLAASFDFSIATNSQYLFDV